MEKKIIAFDKKKFLILIFSGIILTLIAYFLDHPILNAISGMQNNTMISAFSIITSLGEIYIFPLIIVIATIFLLIYKKPFIALWISSAISFSIGYIMKFLIARPRPFQYLNISSIIQVSSSSFPSGHAIAAFTALPILNKSFPKLKILFWILAVLIAISRIYLRVHYLSDVVAGAFIGYIISSLFISIGEHYGWK